MGRVAELFAWLHLPPSIAGLVVSVAGQYRQLFLSSFSKYAL